MTTVWDERYATDEYLFGREPNGFLASQKDLIRPGMKVLSVADGEGRNSVWLAGLGAEVAAMDNSSVGIEKARKLADEVGVTVSFYQCDIAQWTWEPDAYDVVAAIFIQFAPPALRARIFDGMKTTVRPGGLVILQGYGKGQLAYGTGGPSELENLYDRTLLETAFAEFEIVHLREHDSELAEGSRHAGMSALIDMVARKPAS